MRQEFKICLPVYKVVYTVCFAVLLSVVRGIGCVEEIGITLDVYMAALSVVCCADAYQMEYTGKRWEVFCLYPVNSRQKVLLLRVAIQCGYLVLLAVFAYACFFWQKPVFAVKTAGGILFAMTIGAVAVSVVFWGMCAVTFANLCRSSLGGIGISLVLWLFVYSAAGERVLGNYSVFAFVFRDINKTSDLGWIAGKGIAAALALLMGAMQRVMIQYRKGTVKG